MVGEYGPKWEIVKNVRGTPWIYTVRATTAGPFGATSALVKGTEPDWQPLPL